MKQTHQRVGRSFLSRNHDIILLSGQPARAARATSGIALFYLAGAPKTEHHRSCRRFNISVDYSSELHRHDRTGEVSFVHFACHQRLVSGYSGSKSKLSLQVAVRSSHCQHFFLFRSIVAEQKLPSTPNTKRRRWADPT